MNKRALEKTIDAVLSERQFKKRGLTWYREVEGNLQLVNLQKSAFGGQFFINISYVPSGMTVDGMPTPKEHKCPIRIRLTSAFPDRRKEIEEVFDLEDQSVNEVSRSRRIHTVFECSLLPFLDATLDATSLKQAIKRGAFNAGAVNLAAQRHLGLMDD